MVNAFEQAAPGNKVVGKIVSVQKTAMENGYGFSSR